MPYINWIGSTVGNCYRIYMNNRLFCICHDRASTERMISMAHYNWSSNQNLEWKAELCYIENIGF